MFDTQISEKTRNAIHELFKDHGDVLRSVGVFFDYHGGLNQTPQLCRGVWMGAQGRVSGATEIFGSLQSCIYLLAEIMHATESYEEQCRKELLQLAKETKQLMDENERLKKELQEKETEADEVIRASDQ